jgi:hypothetical protein
MLELAKRKLGQELKRYSLCEGPGKAIQRPGRSRRNNAVADDGTFALTTDDWPFTDNSDWVVRTRSSRYSDFGGWFRGGFVRYTPLVNGVREGALVFRMKHT